jgi:hypothetical protein
MPALASMTPLGLAWRDRLPVVLRDSPEHLAVIHSTMREVERLEAAIEQVRRQFFPQQADILLKVWERQVGITVEPPGWTIEQRRTAVVAQLRKMRSSPSGADWMADVSLLVGAGWTYAEHVPGDVTSPPADTVRIELPFPPTSGMYGLIERTLREMIPAHVDLVVTFSGGFVLDESQLDQEAMQ